MTEDEEEWERLLFRRYPRSEWATLTTDIGEALVADGDLRRAATLTEVVDSDEIRAVYTPLSRLLDAEIRGFDERDRLRHTSADGRPYVIGIAGSVSAGKSTTARLLQTMLSRLAPDRRVDLLTTDGFLLPNAELERRGVMGRKGWPESYDHRALIRALSAVRHGRPAVVPTYSHLVYDIVPGGERVIDDPDVLVVEGLNVLQTPRPRSKRDPPVFVSDFFDFGIYVHASEARLRQWYVERFLLLRDSVFGDPTSYFHRYADIPDDQAIRTAQEIWERVNSPNLRRNIEPTRARADLVLEKGDDHRVQAVLLR